MSSQDDLYRLVINCQRRLQKLKEQQASFGLYTPPYIQVEIDDTEAALERLQAELSGLQHTHTEQGALATVAPAGIQVFISYSRRDITFVHQLAADLERAGLITWWDVSRLAGGEIWTQTIETALQNSRYCLVVLSPHSLKAEWVRKEYLYAMRLGLKIITLLYQPCEPPLALTDIQFIDFSRNPYQHSLQELLPLLEAGPSPASAPAVASPQPAAARQKKLTLTGLATGGMAVLLALAWAVYNFYGANTLVNPPARILDAKDVPMVFVPAGSFEMGSVTGEELEQPVHRVTLDAFYIDQFEVTNARYAACVRAGVCSPPDTPSSKTRSNYYGNAEYDDYPVIYVTWNQANTYCQWRRVRLPTEAQWEKAARGTDGRTYPWGEGINCNLANYAGKPDTECMGDTTKTGAYPHGVSPYGAYDMAGNVWEWVNDWFHPDYYSQSPEIDPTGPAEGDGKMLRGGSWILSEHFTRVSSRANYEPGSVIHDFGFRCAAAPPD